MNPRTLKLTLFCTRKEFLTLPLWARRRILKKQADKLEDHYNSVKSGKLVIEDW